jgi:hypothetical protein
VIGSLTDWHGWSWAGWSALVSVGTLLLAWGTFVLARRTDRANATSADALRFEAKKAAEANQPYVVPYGLAAWVQAHDNLTNYHWHDRFPLKNVGPGAALNVTGTFTIEVSEVQLSFAPTSLAAGEAEVVDVQWPPRKPHFFGNGQGRLEYDDIDGTTWCTAFSITGSRRIEVQSVFQRQRRQILDE